MKRRTAWLLIVTAALLAYSNSFRGAFVYDDFYAVRDNPFIRRLWPLTDALSLPLARTGVTVAARPVLSLSFALNHALLGGKPWSYHVGNLLIHIANALLLYAIVRRTAAREIRDSRFEIRDSDATIHHSPFTIHAAEGFALAVALFWVVHPLTTGAVTYISQRAESLAAFWYLLTLYCAMKRMSVVRGPWSVAAVLCCALGMATKETMVSAPLIVYLYDVTFVSQSWGRPLRKRWPLYLGLAASWGVLLLLLGQFRAGVMTQDLSTSPLTYLWTQAAVIMHYLRLVVWPHPLVMVYDWPLAESWRQGVLPAMPLVVLAGGSAWALARHRWPGFVGAWFFLILAPSSSVYPLHEAAFEHRMLLPMAAAIVLVVLGLERLLRRCVHGRPRRGTAAILVSIATIVLGAVTFARNTDYRSEIGLWQQTVRARTGSTEARYYLAHALARADRLHEALRAAEDVLERDPSEDRAMNLAGTCLERLNRPREALTYYRQAVAQAPANADAWNNLGHVQDSLGNVDGAIDAYRTSLRIDPYDPRTHTNLGNALARLGQADEATVHYRQALEIDPDSAATHFNWGNVCAQSGRFEEAVDHYREAVRVMPDDARFHLNLASALAFAGRAEEAQFHIERVRTLRPELLEQ